MIEALNNSKCMNNISRQYDVPRVGSMLVFLPGYAEIMNMRDLIIENFGEGKINLVLLHSSITATAKDLAKNDK